MDAILAAVGGIVVAVIGALLAIKYGLPGVVKDAQAQSAILISNLKAELDLRDVRINRTLADHTQAVNDLQQCRIELRLVKDRLDQVTEDVLRLRREIDHRDTVQTQRDNRDTQRDNRDTKRDDRDLKRDDRDLRRDELDQARKDGG